VRVEVARAAVDDIFQEPDQEERLLEHLRAEAEVLVVAPEKLVVEVNVEQLARVPRLGDGVHEVEAGHVLVRHFRIDADHFRVIKRGDEAEHGPGRRQVEIAARLVGLGFQGELEVVALAERVVAHEVERLAETLSGVERASAGVGLGALAPAPEDVDLRAQFHAQVYGAQRLVQGVGAHGGVVGSESAVFESRVGEQVGGGHRHDQPGLGQRPLEVGDDALALGGRGVNGHQVVIVEIDAIGAHFGQQVHDLHWRERIAHLHTERVAPPVAHRPQAEGEFVPRLGIVVAHARCSSLCYLRCAKGNQAEARQSPISGSRGV